MPGMILLEPGNRILEECVGSQIKADAEAKRDALDVRLCDFDDVSYRIQVEKEDLNILKVSMNLPCYYAIEDKGAKKALTDNYGDYVVDAETGYDMTLSIPLDKVEDREGLTKKLSSSHVDAETGYDMTLSIPLDKVEDREGLTKKLSLIKSNVTGGIFDHFFTSLLEGKEVPEKFSFDLRADTTVYMLPRDDRVTIIFSCDFTEFFDKVLAKVFLQEFVDTRKKIGRAPPTAWGVDPPNELAEFGITENQGNLGYISFAILKSHLDKGKKETVIQVLQTFRTFLQYHIKCSKSHFHSKMRKRVRELLKVLNRAKMEDAKKEKKTVGGKTFKRNK